MRMPSIAAGVLALLAAGCAGESKGASGAGAAPHPVPQRSTPKKPIDLSKPPAVDNSRCYVCHLNYEEETLVRTHAQGAVGCEKCHGESDDHCGDENHETPPDVMFPRDKIAAACWGCHLEVKPGPDFRPPAGADAGKVCTDCHFKHRLDRRERVWDKVSGKILK